MSIESYRRQKRLEFAVANVEKLNAEIKQLGEENAALKAANAELADAVLEFSGLVGGEDE